MDDKFGIFKAAVVAFLVAALVWVWSERESLSGRTTEEIQIVFPVDPVNDLVIRPVNPAWKGTVRIRLEGSVRTVERAVIALGRSVKLSPKLKGMPSEPIDRTEIDLRVPIADLPELAGGTGVIAEVDPPKVVVAVERMVTRALPVRVSIGKALPIDGDPVASPAMVEIRMSEAAAATLSPDARALAVVSDAELTRLRQDGPQSVTATVRPPEGLPAGALVLIKPESVSVTIRLRQTLDTVKVPTVPVWFSLPPTEDGAKWSIEILDKFLTDVTVSGPSEDVQRVRAGQMPVKALVEFTSDELERAAADKEGTTKQATFTGLPPGVSCTVENGVVRVKVSKR